MAVVILNSFTEFPNIRAKNRFVKNGTANFSRNIPTELCGLPPEMFPNIPFRRTKTVLSIAFEFRPKFPESLGAFHYAKDSRNFGRNSNGKIHFGFF